MWSKRNLTLLGKITVVKTLALPLITHLLYSLPNPGKKWISEINTVFYRFIWGYKPDKIKRDTMILEYGEGGLKMIHIESFMKYLKIKWVKRLYDGNGDWQSLAKSNFSKFGGERLWNLKKSKLEEISKNVTNVFWKDVILAWKEYKDDNNEVSSFLGDDLLNYIPVPRYKQFIEYERNGVKTVKDLLDNNYQFLSFNDIKTKCEKMNFLQYFAVIDHIPRENLNIIRQQPLINNQSENSNPLRRLLQAKDLRYVYKAIVANYKHYPIERQEKWNRKLNTNLNDDIGWEKIYLTSFLVTIDTKLQNLQFKILHRILTTNSFLYQINVKDEDLCTFCRDAPESIEHLFFNCVKINNIWNDLMAWVNDLNNNIIIIDHMNIKDVLFFCEKMSSLNNTMNKFNQKWSPLNI
ncbi:uncharacterized protein LOC110452408 [Mizuhopecten yessoensis]|uniref:uncharacterized protein LOC110452408 n=1 Tax=Mizuhopecten yessoensis TaxID=6573 RepID=UPI000B45987F|nr:uncharacterized protein LOC110452408 [Mizuhopecten yessoensis]